jgi:myosin heavy subunit
MSVKFRRSSPNGGYEHQRSDSGFSDCESHTSTPDRGYLVPGNEDPGIYSIRRALESSRQECDEAKTRARELERTLKKVTTELEEAKARMRALSNENENLVEEKKSLTKSNKELADQNAQLEETIKELNKENKELSKENKDLKKANRKSTSGSSPSGSSGNASESSDEKKLHRSSSKRRKEPSGRTEKEKERDREREKEKEKDRARERRKEEKAAQEEQDRLDRLRQRFDTRGEESDAKSSNTSTRSQRNRSDSYIEPLGHPAPRPQVSVTGPLSPPIRQYPSYAPATTPAYSTTQSYQSIREPYSATTPRPHHPAVYVAADEFSTYGVADEQYAVPRSTRHAR